MNVIYNKTTKRGRWFVAMSFVDTERVASKTRIFATNRQEATEAFVLFYPNHKLKSIRATKIGVDVHFFKATLEV